MCVRTFKLIISHFETKFTQTGYIICFTMLQHCCFLVLDTAGKAARVRVCVCAPLNAYNTLEGG